MKISNVQPLEEEEIQYIFAGSGIEIHEIKEELINANGDIRVGWVIKSSDARMDIEPIKNKFDKLNYDLINLSFGDKSIIYLKYRKELNYLKYLEVKIPMYYKVFDDLVKSYIEDTKIKKVGDYVNNIEIGIYFITDDILFYKNKFKQIYFNLNIIKNLSKMFKIDEESIRNLLLVSLREHLDKDIDNIYELNSQEIEGIKKVF
jgi:hypothetical protein